MRNCDHWTLFKKLLRNWNLLSIRELLRTSRFYWETETFSVCKNYWDHLPFWILTWNWEILGTNMLRTWKLSKTTEKWQVAVSSLNWAIIYRVKESFDASSQTYDLFQLCQKNGNRRLMVSTSALCLKVNHFCAPRWKIFPPSIKKGLWISRKTFQFGRNFN